MPDTQSLASILALRDQFIDQGWSVDRLFAELIVQFLQPQHRAIVELAERCPNLNSHEVTFVLGVSQSQAATVLAMLTDYGLLTREEHRDARGRWFTYKVRA